MAKSFGVLEFPHFRFKETKKIQTNTKRCGGTTKNMKEMQIYKKSTKETQKKIQKNTKQNTQKIQNLEFLYFFSYFFFVFLKRISNSRFMGVCALVVFFCISAIGASPK